MLGDRLVRITGDPQRDGGLRVAGEIDLSNVDLLGSALAAAASAGADIHIEAERLEFIDVIGVRRLLDTAWSIAPGRRLYLHQPQPVVRRLVDLLEGFSDLIEVAP